MNILLLEILSFILIATGIIIILVAGCLVASCLSAIKIYIEYKKSIDDDMVNRTVNDIHNIINMKTESI